MRARWKSVIVACAVAITVVTGCKPAAAPVEEVVLKSLTGSMELAVGDTAVVAYSVSPEGTSVFFESSHPEAFTVTAEGEIRGVAGGEGHVIITAGDLTTKVAVRVATPEEGEEPELVELGIAIRTDHIVLAVGETHSLDDVVTGEDTDDLELFVEIGDFDVIDMDDDGLLIALAAGETTVSLYNDFDFDETLLVTVVEDSAQKGQPRSAFTLTQVQGGSGQQTAAASNSTAAGNTAAAGSVAAAADKSAGAPEAAGGSGASGPSGGESSAPETPGLESRADDSAKATQVDVDAYAQEVVRLVNKERASAGLPALSAHSGLMSAADTRAQELVTLFSHTRPDGTKATAMASAASGSYYTGENIAKGYKTPAAVVKGWMNSSGHRANILREGFDQIGVGCYQSGGTLHWVQLFSGAGSSGGGGSDSGQSPNTARTQKRAELKNSTISATSLRLDVGQTQQLHVNLGSSDTKDVEVVWEADGGITVSGSGMVTATSADSYATVAAIVYFEESPIVRLSCRVTVLDPQEESSRENGSGGADNGGGDDSSGGWGNGGGNATDGGATDPDPNESSSATEPDGQESTPTPDEEA